MTQTRVPFIAGNWKMNLDHQQAIALVQKLAWTLRDANHDYATTEVAVFAPFTDLRTVQTLIDAEKIEIKLGAQDLSQHDSGAYTGDISGAFLKKLNCKYVLIGHSERRSYHHESDELVQAKVAAAFKHGLVPVICVGVKSANVAGFLRSPEVDGVLVGGASLDVEEFSGISRFLKHLAL